MPSHQGSPPGLHARLVTHSLLPWAVGTGQAPVESRQGGPTPSLRGPLPPSLLREPRGFCGLLGPWQMGPRLPKALCIPAGRESWGGDGVQTGLGTAGEGMHRPGLSLCAGRGTKPPLRVPSPRGPCEAKPRLKGWGQGQNCSVAPITWACVCHLPLPGLSLRLPANAKLGRLPGEAPVPSGPQTGAGAGCQSRDS